MRTRISLCLCLTLFVTYASILHAGAADEETEVEKVKLRFRGSDPGPPIKGVAIDDSIGLTLTEDRRFRLMVNLQAPEDTTVASGGKIHYRARAQMVDQVRKNRKGKKTWVDVDTIGSTEWIKLEPTLELKDGSIKLKGKTTATGRAKKQINYKPLEITITVTLSEDNVLLAEAVSTWDKGSSDAEWDHKLSIVREKKAAEKKDSSNDKPEPKEESDAE